MTRRRGTAWLALAALAALGCSGGTKPGGEQPYGAGANANDEELPESGEGAQPAGVGGEGGGAGVNPMGGVGGDLIAGLGGEGSEGGKGGAPELPACDETSQPMPIGACVTLPEPSEGEYLGMIGVVEAIEQPGDTSCAQRALGFMVGADPSEVYDVVIRDGDRTARISVRLPPQLPWSTSFVSVGETVLVDYKAELPMDSVGHGELTIRDERGLLRLWVVQAAHGFDSIGIPELRISNDQTRCSAIVPCGSSTRGSILAFDGANEASVDYTSFGEVGELVVLLADNTNVTIADTCTSARSFHRVVVVAMRGGGIPPTD